MVRVVLALLVLAGCDQLFQIDHVTLSDGSTDGVTGDSTPSGPHYFQGNSSLVSAGTGASVQVLLPNPSTAGDLLVVFVGWTGTASVAQVADNHSDVFQLAGGTAVGGNMGQATYYAQNISGAATQVIVTVNFASTTTGIDVRVAEYMNMAKSGAFQGGMNATGSGALMTTSSFAVPAKSVLVAGFMSNDTTIAPGKGFSERIKTGVGNYVEDREIDALGNYVGDALQNNTGAFVANAAAFSTQ